MRKQQHILILGLSLSLYACPDSTSGGEGGTEGGSINVAGDDLSGIEAGESMSGMTMSEACFNDSDCAEGSYCYFDEETLTNLCVEGCTEDSCEGGRTCDLDTRECS